MKLLVDIGNSRIKWAFGTAGRLVAEGSASGGVDGSLAPLLECSQVPEEIRIASVAGADAGVRVAAILKERFRIAPVFARSAASGAGVRSGYSDPVQLGVDRWLAMCAAFSRYRGAVCVADAGTATTLDLVTASGEHKGGLILPGIDLMQSALLRGTGNLARLSVGAFTAARSPTGDVESGMALGRDTDAAIRYGAVQATASLARQCMEVLRAGTQPSANPGVLVVTGGAAATLQAALVRQGGIHDSSIGQGYRLEHRQQLVLEGLALEPPCFAVAG